MKNSKYSLFEMIYKSFSVLGFIFFLNVGWSYILGYKQPPMLTEEFMVGKTIPEAYLKENLAILLVSIITYLASTIYQKNEWTFLKRTIISFGISIVSFIIMLDYLKILNNQYLYGLLASLVIFIAMYLISWSRQYKKDKDDIRKINQELKKTGN